MSLCDRRHVLKFALLVPLAACGLSPVYGPDTAPSLLVGRTRFPEPVNEDTFDLTRQLERRLGRASSAAFELRVAPFVRSDSLAITGSNNITRFNLIGVANYTLSDIASGQTLLSGSVDTFASYSASGSTASTVAAERDARNRLMVALADLTVTRLEADAASVLQ